MSLNKFRELKQKLKVAIFREKDFVSITPDSKIKGRVLLSYLIEPFLLKPNQPMPNFHTNYWECLQIAKTFINFGYKVDVISYKNEKFIPKHKYSYFIDIYKNMERLSPILNHDCVKILHITGAHWLFNNQATYKRLLALQQRRGVTLVPTRIGEPNLGIEHADYATILGNKFTIDTYSYAKKPIYRIPISTNVQYPWLEDKDYESCRHNFLWFGSSGMVHKGLDLVLEAFAKMPEYHLTVCGSVNNEKDFENAFYKELYQTPNIHTIGWVDVSGSKFLEIVKNCIGLIYPSCSEGGGGSVINCMHAGLIPIVSYESSVDVMDFGFILADSSIEEIQNYIKTVSHLPLKELKLRARKSWEFAVNTHTCDNFSQEYQKFITHVLSVK